MKGINIGKILYAESITGSKYYFKEAKWVEDIIYPLD